MFRATIWIGLCLSLLFTVQKATGQHAANDTILLGAVIENGDTIAVVYLPEFEKIGEADKQYAKRLAEYNQLRYNVYKVYPYAVIAAGILKSVDDDMARLPDKRARKAYIKGKEKELNSRFKNDLENLSIAQGQILVKLIDRETGKNCYGIIKEMKGGFSAVIWQSVAMLFSNNLKREYDPTDRDKDIEQIVQEIEAYNYHRYQMQQQTMMRRNRLN
ncbi:MAG TPA: DUF4294 domain-containing protein [Flavipsychrobacter sp.]|nr:DUF4294 domain-containing protein [Flavipsychrobacter sp.]